MERIYNKLVRDNIPEIIKQKGEETIIKILNDDEYKKELENKLIEEYKEVINSSGEDRCEELADMIEVIRCLAELENKKIEDIINIADNKSLKRGAFKNKIYLEKVISGIK